MSKTKALDEILFDFIGMTDNTLILPEHEEAMLRTKESILTYIKSIVPKKKFETIGRRQKPALYREGWNACRDEMLNRLGEVK